MSPYKMHYFSTDNINKVEYHNKIEISIRMNEAFIAILLDS